MRDAVAGIDVSATRGLDVAVILRTGTLVETAWIPDHDALRIWLEVWSHRLSVVAVDAPGGVARGSGGRRAERDLRGRGISLYLTPPTPIEDAPSWMQQGWQIFGQLRELGFPEARELGAVPPCAIECYPYATYVALAKARRPSAEPAPTWARRVLGKHVRRLVGTGKDAPDAVAAALTARAYACGDAVAYGDPSEGVIWVVRDLPDFSSAAKPNLAETGRRGSQTREVNAAPRTDRAPCACGCGSIPAGPQSRFLPGHDAKLHARHRREAPADKEPGATTLRAI